MWQRFTALARRAVFEAQVEALKVGDGYVSTEHLLLAVLKVEDPAIPTLLAGIAASEDIEAKVRAQIPFTPFDSTKDMMLTGRARRAIDLSYDESRHLSSSMIGCEHLFLGLLREAEGLAGKVLASCGFELEDARLRALKLPSSGTSASIPRPAPRTSPSELLHIRQRRYALDRLAALLLADPSLADFLAEKSVRYGAIQSSLEELMMSAPTQSELQDPPELSAVFEKAQGLAGEEAMGLQHLFVAIAQEEATFLHAIVKDLGIDLPSLLI